MNRRIKHIVMPYSKHWYDREAHSVVTRAQERAISSGSWVYDIFVAVNDYWVSGYESTDRLRITPYNGPAYVMLIVANPGGLVACFMTQKKTGVASFFACAEFCVPGAGKLWDKRIKTETPRDKARAILQQAHAKQFSGLEQLAACAE